MIDEFINRVEMANKNFFLPILPEYFNMLSVN